MRKKERKEKKRLMVLLKVLGSLTDLAVYMTRNLFGDWLLDITRESSLVPSSPGYAVYLLTERPGTIFGSDSPTTRCT